MTEKVKIDEDILVRCPKDISIDPELPFRLQKIQLFKKLRFPTTKMTSIPVKDQEKIKIVFEEFIEKRLPFLIVTSPKPMSTLIPPLFRVNMTKTAIYRDIYGNIELINSQQIFHKIEELPLKSWIGFTKNIWGKKTIAGRLLYASAEEQVLEIQKGVEMAELGENRNDFPYLSVTLHFFELSAGTFAFEKSLIQSGFKRIEIVNIINSLRQHIQGFEELKEISPFPALEFGYINKGGLRIIDVDWPRQWIY